MAVTVVVMDIKKGAAKIRLEGGRRGGGKGVEWEPYTTQLHDRGGGGGGGGGGGEREREGEGKGAY